MPVIRWLFRNVFNSVPFGIVTMVTIGLYIALGSGWVGLREHLEMDEMLFFNWWPLKLLIVLLISNLTVVTVVRIPFTPPRYGVWTIHMGIILLLLSLSSYYTLKTEGLVPLVKGQTMTHYYDRWERALFVRTQFATGRPVTLAGLPRFHEYDGKLGNGSYLDQPAFKDIQPQMSVVDMKTDQRSLVSLGEAVGTPDPIKLDIVGYYPYGVAERWKIDPAVNNVGLKVTNAKNPGSSAWLVASQAAEAIIPVGEAVLEHRHVPTKADIDLSTGAAKRLHKLTISSGGVTKDTFVEPGDEVQVGATGYTIKVEGFTPQFTLSDGKSAADALTVMVTKREGMIDKSFRRIILSGQDSQTDFELNVAGAGPLGKRKRDGLLDAGIQIQYAFNDPTKLLPTMQASTVKYLLFTSDDTAGITMLRISSREPSSIDVGENKVDLQITAPPPIFAATGGDQELGTLNIERNDHVAMSNAVVAVPPDQRNRNSARGGEGQMIRVRVRSGSWSQEFPVPFDSFAADNRWASPKIHVPGAKDDFQLMLGNALLPLPVAVRLENFEPVPYAGGDLSGNGFMRDFRSTITMIDTETGRSTDATASLNSPAFLKLPSRFPLVPGESWLFSQATWNPDNLDFTVLQVGNRPAVQMMVIAFGMIFAGVMYAFYAKPFVIKAMKRNAIRAAEERKRKPANEADPILVPSPGMSGRGLG